MKKIVFICMGIFVLNLTAAESQLLELYIQNFSDGVEETFMVRQEDVCAYYAKDVKKQVADIYPFPFLVNYTREIYAPYNDLFEAEETRVYFSQSQLETFKNIMQQSDESGQFDSLKSFLMHSDLFYCSTRWPGYCSGEKKRDHSLKIGTSKPRAREEGDLSLMEFVALLAKGVSNFAAKWYRGGQSEQPKEDGVVRIRTRYIERSAPAAAGAQKQ